MKQIEEGLVQFRHPPTLLLWGMKDPVLGVEVLRRWQHLFPHATTHEVEDASHFLWEDAPEQLVAWMQAFVEAHP